jgi:hypothetical protein
MDFEPLADYSGYQHVLMAGACFVHPGNGNVYYAACEQQGGVKQNLSVYRVVSGSNAPRLVKRYHGTIDSSAQITFGTAVIGASEDMLVATSLIIPNAPRVTNTGFQGCWIRELNIDEPYPLLGALEQRIVAIETALANISQGGLDAKDREALDRLRTMLRL